MSYSDVPLTGQTLGNTRVPINTNFSLIQTAMSVNHYAIASGSQGKHKFLQMPEEAAAPTTAVNEGGFYTKEGISPAETQLFYRGENNGNEWQLTNVSSGNFGTFGTNNAYGTPPAGYTQKGGWTFLPGAMLLQYGVFSRGGGLQSANRTVQFPITFTTVYNVTISILRAASGADQGEVIISLSDNQFVFSLTSTSATSTALYWQALGTA